MGLQPSRFRLRSSKLKNTLKVVNVDAEPTIDCGPGAIHGLFDGEYSDNGATSLTASSTLAR